MGRRWAARLAVLLLSMVSALVAPGPGRAVAQTAEATPDTTVVLGVGQGRLLRFDEPAGTVLVADSGVADVQIVAADLAFLFGNAPGTTNLIVVAPDRRILGNLRIDVVGGIPNANEALTEIQPGTTIRLRSVNGRLVVSGEARTVSEALDAAAIARTASPDGGPPLDRTTYAGSNQINLRVRFAEVSRTDVDRLGINWQALIGTGNFAFGLSTGRLAAGIAAAADTFATGRADFSAGGKDITLLLDALQRQGLLQTLAEPNLTVLNGETASFLAGGEVPIPVPQQEETITIQYKTFGISLEFTPTLLPGDRIGIRVKPEVSSILANGGIAIGGASVPAFQVRRAQTTVELASGQTFAIAGLFQREFARDLDGIPLISDLPILGQLFRSERFQRNETELVILITPYLVEPTGRIDPATPGQPAGNRPAAAGFLTE